MYETSIVGTFHVILAADTVYLEASQTTDANLSPFFWTWLATELIWLYCCHQTIF